MKQLQYNTYNSCLQKKYVQLKNFFFCFNNTLAEFIKKYLNFFAIIRFLTFIFIV